MISKIRQLGEMIKVSHSIFALPFALAAMLLAADGVPSFRTFFLIFLAMVAARNAGMSFNRYLDAEIDARNPRTAERHVPAGIFSKKFVFAFSLLNALAFGAVTFFINPLAFHLSPIALGIIYLYSWTKRFTHWSHLFLGLALGISPIGAWIAVTGTISPESILLGTAVIFWVAGFDIIYATQDHEFDRREGLHSLVVRFGVSKALWISRLFHLITVVLLLIFGQRLHLGWAYDLSWLLILFLFGYQHSIVSAKNLTRVNAAFFNVNGFISLIFLAGVVLSIQ